MAHRESHHLILAHQFDLAGRLAAPVLEMPGSKLELGYTPHRSRRHLPRIFEARNPVLVKPEEHYRVDGQGTHELAEHSLAVNAKFFADSDIAGRDRSAAESVRH